MKQPVIAGISAGPRAPVLDPSADVPLLKSEQARRTAFARVAHDLEGPARAFLRMLEERNGGRR